VGFAGTFFTNMVLTNTPDTRQDQTPQAVELLFTVAAPPKPRPSSRSTVLIAAVACLHRRAGRTATHPPGPALERGTTVLSSAAWIVRLSVHRPSTLAGGAGVSCLPNREPSRSNFAHGPDRPGLSARTMSTWGDRGSCSSPAADGLALSRLASLFSTCPRRRTTTGAMPGWAVYSGYAVAVLPTSRDGPGSRSP